MSGKGGIGLKRGLVLFLFFLVSSAYFFRCSSPNRREEAFRDGGGESSSAVDGLFGEFPAEGEVRRDSDGGDSGGVIDKFEGDGGEEGSFEKKPKPPKYPKDGWSATIVHVTDGDTLHVTMYPGGWASRVRLKGINAPECQKGGNGGFQSCVADDEFFGLEAYKTLERLVKKYGRKVIIRCKAGSDGFCSKDLFKRYLVYLEFKSSGEDLGRALLSEGAVWTFTRYPSEKLAEYCAAEAEAIKNRRGMWKNGRDYVRQKMKKSTRSWYYSRSRTKSHDAICSKALGKSFSKLAGE